MCGPGKWKWIDNIISFVQMFRVCFICAGNALCFDIIDIGKAEDEDENWHGHVSAVSVSPFYRRLHLGNDLMRYIEVMSELFTFLSM